MISATNQSLPEMIKQGKFREDLYYRLNVVELHLPPLRERPDDISLLAYHFLQKYSQVFNKHAKCFSQATQTALERYNWPGNVRELENVIQRAVVLSDGRTVEICNLPVALRWGMDEPAFTPGALLPTAESSYEQELKRFKRSLVLRTLRRYGWRKAESARALGVARGYLHRLINQLDIRESDEVRSDPPAPGNSALDTVM